MRRFIVAVAVLGFMSDPVLAESQCSLFADKVFGGASLPVPANQPLSTLPAALDNAISSVKVAEGCILVGYADPHFKGHTQTWGAGSYEQLPAEWDNVISSAQCNCR